MNASFVSSSFETPLSFQPFFVVHAMCCLFLFNSLMLLFFAHSLESSSREEVCGTACISCGILIAVSHSYSTLLCLQGSCLSGSRSWVATCLSLCACRRYVVIALLQHATATSVSARMYAIIQQLYFLSCNINLYLFMYSSIMTPHASLLLLMCLHRNLTWL